MQQKRETYKRRWTAQGQCAVQHFHQMPMTGGTVEEEYSTPAGCPRLLLEQRKNGLRVCIGDGEGLDTKLLLSLKRFDLG